jgi:DnaJ-class molecular chaperone
MAHCFYCNGSGTSRQVLIGEDLWGHCPECHGYGFTVEEGEPADLDINGTPIAIDRNDDGTYTAEVNGTPTGDTYPTYQAAVDGAIGYAQSLE